MTILEGAWDYQSFLILSTSPGRDATPVSPLALRRWAMGTLTLAPCTSPDVRGELTFAPGVALTVKGHITPASDMSPTVLVATGEGLSGPTKGSLYQIAGTAVIDANKRQSIHGWVLAVRGPDANPKKELGGLPTGTVGTFVLSEQAAGG